MAAKSRKPAASKSGPASTKQPPPPAKTLLQLVKALPPMRPASFLDKLPAEVIAELVEIRLAYQNKKLPAHMTALRIYREVVAVQLPDACSESTFRKWMNASEARNG